MALREQLAISWDNVEKQQAHVHQSPSRASEGPRPGSAIGHMHPAGCSTQRSKVKGCSRREDKHTTRHAFQLSFSLVLVWEGSRKQDS